MARPSPRLAFLEPMAPLRVAELPEGDDWIYEIKWDGYRALAYKEGKAVRLVSRNDKSLSADFPGVLAELLNIEAKSALIDGELVAMTSEGKPSFQALQNRRTKPASVVFYAFDLLHLNGTDFLAAPLETRKAKLAEVIAGTGFVCRHR